MQAWMNFLNEQEKELGSALVNKWLKSLKVLSFDARNIYLEAKDHFQAIWFEEHIRKKAQLALVNNNDRKIKIHLSIAQNQLNKKIIEKPKGEEEKYSKEKTAKEAHPFTLTFDLLDHYYTFDHYIVTEKNLVPFTLLCESAGFLSPAQSSSSSPKLTFNPIYLWGYSGSGKTHLLSASAKIYKDFGLKTIYVRAETFTNHVVSAIRAGEMSAFRTIYRNVDVLIIDDVHEFSKKGATQEELFHTFNALHLAGKQIILSANCLPQHLQKIEARLISRFEWGIVLEVELLPKDQLIQFIQKKCSLLNFPLNTKVQELLLDTFQNSIKSLTKSIQALNLRVELEESKGISSTSLSPSSVKTILQDLISEHQQQELNPDKIIQIVAQVFHLPLEDILGKSQRKSCTLPRQISMYLFRSKLGLPFTQIGAFFERDHSTVMTSIKRIQNEFDQGNKEIVDLLALLSNKLQSLPLS